MAIKNYQLLGSHQIKFLARHLRGSFSAKRSVVAGSDRSPSVGTRALFMNRVGPAGLDRPSDCDEGEGEQDPIGDGEGDGGVCRIARARVAVSSGRTPCTFRMLTDVCQ